MRPDLERRMIEDLARLRREPPFTVEVAARVVAEVRRLGPPPRQSIASRSVVFSSAAAVLVLAAGMALLLLPGFPVWMADATQAAARAAGLTGTIARFTAWVPGAAAQAIGRCVDFLAAFRGVAELLAPAVAAALAAALLGMAGITTFIVGRDLRRGRVEAR